MAEAIANVRMAGGLFIADEVQPGFARTGESMWGYEHHGLVPDMVAMGKPMGNGYPIGGVAVKPDLLETFGATTGYFNTFGGNPVAAAAGLAVLETIEAENLQENALVTGAYLRAELEAVAERCDCVGDVRGKGLYIGVEFVRDRKSKKPDRQAATRIVDMLRDRNVLVGIAGPYGNVLKIRPPLPFGREHADMLVKALSDSLASHPNHLSSALVGATPLPAMRPAPISSRMAGSSMVAGEAKTRTSSSAKAALCDPFSGDEAVRGAAGECRRRMTPGTSWERNLTRPSAEPIPY